MRGKKFALDREFNLFVMIGALFLCGACALISGDELGLGIGIGTIGLFFITVPAILMPFLYVFDENGVSICYLFLPKERYLWKNIDSIEATDDGDSSRNPILDFIFSRVFEITGVVEGKERFYMKGHIRRSRHTKRLLEKYWDGEITGYFLQGVKEWVQKRKDSKNSKIKSINTDGIAATERELRASAKEWIKPCIDEATQYDLELNIKFVYVTRDLKELNSRPKERYAYTAIVSISHRGEKDERCIVEVSTDLLYARIGKNAYQGVKNKKAKDELDCYLACTLNEIKANGIEAYCEERKTE